MKVYLFLAEGFEEIEALACVDILRRAGIDVTTVALTDEKHVTGSHRITVHADILFDEAGPAADMLILPGGPGRKHYYTHDGLTALVKNHNSQNKYIAAICGAPAYLAWTGMLDGKTAVCHPSEEAALANAKMGNNCVETDGNIITSKAAGTTIPFALKIIELLLGKDESEKIKDEILY